MDELGGRLLAAELRRQVADDVVDRTRALHRPNRALLAFAGGTGGLTDVHTVSAVTITQNAPAGPIVGIASKCVDVRAANTANGTPVQLYTCNGTAAQQWTVGTDQTLRALGKCMDVTGAGTANGTKVQLYTCNGTGA